VRRASILIAFMLLACSSSEFVESPDAGAPPDTGPAPLTPDASTSETAYSRAVLGDTPLLYWRFDESSGGTARDFTTNALDGTYSANGVERGLPSLVRDVNPSIKLSAGGSVDGPNDARLGFAGQAAFSVECWVSFAQPPNAIQTIVARSSDKDTSGWQLWVDPQGGALRAYFGRYEGGTGVTVATSEATPLAIGDAHHLVAVYDGAKVSLHLNGVANEQKDSAVALTDRNYKLRVGRGEDLAGTLSARIDELAVYPNALPGERMKAHHDLGKSGQP
jgi:hypothetical protein